MMVINNNIPALNAYDVVNNTSSQLQKSIQKLSTGLRINSASDDAAGLSISEKMRAQINGLDQAVRNTQDGVSLIQTAEGALTETHSILQRMRELSVQAANDTYTAQDRSYIQEEVDLLREEIDHIGNTTTFNTKKLLNGDSAVLWSSDNLNTKAIINGGLRDIDQFGQKSSAEGNYKITVKAKAGVGEVQKTEIFRVKHDVDPWYATVKSPFGIATSDQQKAPEIKGGGTYTITGNVISNGDNAVAAASTQVAHVGGNGDFTTSLSNTTALNDNFDIKFTVTNVDTTANTVTLAYEGTKIGKDGQVSDSALKGNVTLNNTQQTIALQKAATSPTTVTAVNLQLSALAAGDSTKYKVGEEFVYNINASAAAGTAANDGVESLVTVSGTPTSGVMKDHKYVINNNSMTNNTANFKVSYTDADPSDPSQKIINQGDVYLTTNSDFKSVAKDGTWVTYRKNTALPDPETAMWQTALNKEITAAAINDNVPKEGVYTIDHGGVTTTAANGSATNVGGNTLGTWTVTNSSVTETVSGAATGSGWIKLVAQAPTGTSGSRSVTLAATAWGTNESTGAAIQGATANITIETGTNSGQTQVSIGGVTFGKITLSDEQIGNIQAGQEFYYRIQGSNEANDVTVTLAGQGENGKQTLPDLPTYSIANTATAYNLVTPVSKDGSAIDFSKLDWSTTSKDFGIFTVTGDIDGTNVTNKRAATIAWQADKTEKISSSIGEVATGDNKLRDLEQFWDEQGNFMLDDPQTITITQGDGQTAKVTLYKYDTLNDVANKLNDAIANDLGQGKYVDTAGATKFATFVDRPTENTSEAVQGTMLIRSAVPGSNGTLNFASKNEDLINALGLNTIKTADDSVYSITIEDAHTGEVINNIKDESITGNVLVGRLHKNVDVEFDALTGISATWDNRSKSFTINGSDTGEVTYLHLADNTMTFQIGANEGDDMGINIGDMRSHALGLDGVLVTDREAASRSISIIDSAIDKVSTQRAKLGAYQNRLEHTAANLTTSAENLTAAESRIRDTDMAKEMMNFTKLQIMLQAGNSMLAQANQLPQNVLSLIR